MVQWREGVKQDLGFNALGDRRWRITFWCEKILKLVKSKFIEELAQVHI